MIATFFLLSGKIKHQNKYLGWNGLKKVEIPKQIIELFITGDQDAFKTIYDLTFPFIAHGVGLLLKNSNDTEDLVHDIFIKIYTKRHTFNHSVKFTTWVYQIAMNHTLNHLKRKHLFLTKIWQGLTFQYQESTPSLMDQVIQNESDGLIRKLLEQIEPAYRVCLVLRDLEGLSYSEIAETLRISIPAVKSRIHRGRQTLAQLYLQEVRDEKIKFAMEAT